MHGEIGKFYSTCIPLLGNLDFVLNLRESHGELLHRK